MKVLLISPNNPYNCYRVPQFGRWVNLLTDRLNFQAGGVFPGLNLAAVAALTPADIEVEIIDESVEQIRYDTDADLIGITAMTNMAPTAYAISEEFRRRGKKTVLGGVHVTVVPQEAAQYCDAVCVGEAEYSWPRIVEDHRRGQMQKFYRADRMFDMRNMPIPRRDLLRRERYFIPNTVETARGCPFDCEFCSVSRTAGRAYRFRPIDEVMHEIDTLDNRWIFFIDDIINGNHRRARELFAAMRGHRVNWAGQATVTIADDPELLRLARRGGCKVLFIGFESFTATNLKKLGKPSRWRQRFFEAVDKIHQQGIAIWGAFVFGLDTDTLEMLEETVEVCIKAKLEFAQFSTLTPLPGTALWNQFEAEGRITTYDWTDYSFGNIVFQPAKLDAEELKAALANAWGRFYSYRSMWLRLHHLPWRLSTGLVVASNLGITKLVRRALKKGVKTRAAGQPAAEIERRKLMRQLHERPPVELVLHILGSRDHAESSQSRAD